MSSMIRVYRNRSLLIKGLIMEHKLSRPAIRPLTDRQIRLLNRNVGARHGVRIPVHFVLRDSDRGVDVLTGFYLASSYMYSRETTASVVKYLRANNPGQEFKVVA